MQGVFSSVTSDLVVARSAGHVLDIDERIVSGSPGGFPQGQVDGDAAYGVGVVRCVQADPTVKDVVALAADKDVIAVAAGQHIGAAGAGQHVVVIRSDDVLDV